MRCGKTFKTKRDAEQWLARKSVELEDGELVARPSFFQLQQVRKARSQGIPLHLITHEDVLVLIKQAQQDPADGHPIGGAHG